mgnify:CR=1 FL=1
MPTSRHTFSEDFKSGRTFRVWFYINIYKKNKKKNDRRNWKSYFKKIWNNLKIG